MFPAKQLQSAREGVLLIRCASMDGQLLYYYYYIPKSNPQICKSGHLFTVLMISIVYGEHTDCRIKSFSPSALYASLCLFDI